MSRCTEKIIVTNPNSPLKGRRGVGINLQKIFFLRIKWNVLTYIENSCLPTPIPMWWKWMKCPDLKRKVLFVNPHCNDIECMRPNGSFDYIATSTYNTEMTYLPIRVYKVMWTWDVYKFLNLVHFIIVQSGGSRIFWTGRCAFWRNGGACWPFLTKNCMKMRTFTLKWGGPAHPFNQISCKNTETNIVFNHDIQLSTILKHERHLIQEYNWYTSIRVKNSWILCLYEKIP